MLIRMESMINCRHTRPNSQLRLFCFPWAGGGTNYYVNWAKTLSDSIEGDGRMDSPGHSAQFCTYTMMDNADKSILSIMTIDKRETEGKSTLMEKVGFQKSVSFLKQQNVNVVECVTDAHLQIGALMICAVRLAGREIRLNDKPCGDMLTTVANIANTLLPKFQSKPFAFFGHSMGSVLSFEVALYLKKYYGLEPVHLFVSGFTSPQSAGQRIATDWINMPEDEFLENIKRIGGTPQEVLENRDLMKMYMPSLRADFHMVSHYRYNLPDSVPLTCPVSFTDGDNDKPHDVAGWAKITNGEFKSQTMPGGHFYFYNKENERQLLKYITEKLL